MTTKVSKGVPPLQIPKSGNGATYKPLPQAQSGTHVQNNSQFTTSNAPTSKSGCTNC